MKEFERHKVDLHLHLDGSLPYSVIPKLAKISGEEIDPDQIVSLFSVQEGCTSLVDYLKCFELPGKLLQTRECLSLATAELVRQLYSENVLTAEIRFAPQLHKQRGLKGTEIVESVLQGMETALKDCPGMKAGIILCMMITGTDEENAETVELARQYLGKGVIALDIAGPEGMIPLENFSKFFETAKAYQLPYTIHAGECGDYRNIDKALDLGANRIGHGVAAIYSQDTIDRLVRTQTPIEVCVISNLQTLAIPENEVHPVKKLMDAGVCVTINTDNRTVSQTNLSKEYDVLQRNYGFSNEDLLIVQENGRKASFIK